MPGDSLAGWRAAGALGEGAASAQGWRVVDGELIGAPGAGALASVQPVADCELRLEVWGEVGATPGLRVGGRPIPLQSGENGWQRLRVMVVGDRVAVWRNGRLQVDFERVDPDGATRESRGQFVVEAGAGGSRWRGLFVRQLGDANEFRPSAHLARAEPPGFRALFDGSSFAGWRVSPAAAQVWTVERGRFVARPGIAVRQADLWTEESFRDFELVVDWRLPGRPVDRPLPVFDADGLIVRGPDGKPLTRQLPHAGDSGVYLRGLARYQVNIWSQPMGSGDINELHKDASLAPEIRRALMPALPADAPVGEWNRFHLLLRGSRLTVWLNGRKVIDHAELPGIPAEGPIGLQYHRDAVEFANVFLRPIGDVMPE